MIRPFTFLTAALALGSGFYLYQAKHRTQLLDARISTIEQETAGAQNRIAVLRAEWALENAPSRLADLAAHYLVLVPMSPTQAVSMRNLASRLPPPMQPGAISPAVGDPDLVALAGPQMPARYASVEYFASPSPASPSLPAESPPARAPVAVVAHESEPPPAVTTAAVEPAPIAAPRPPPTPAPPPAPSTIARLSPPKESAPAPLAPPKPDRPIARPALASAPPTPIRARPAPILTSSLGGSYPDLPPPAPLAGSH